MDNKVYAYYRTASSVVVEKDVRVSPRRWRALLLDILQTGNDVWQLHLDNPTDFALIRERFFTPDYWAGRSWQQEYNV